MLRTLEALRRDRPSRAGAPGIYVRLDDPFGHAVLAPAARRRRVRGLGKIAALGIKVSRHCTYHGVALNVAMDLEPFARINPCGYAGLQTVDLSTIGVHTTWDEVAADPRRQARRLPEPPMTSSRRLRRDAKQKAEAKMSRIPIKIVPAARC